jgi:hypothetical protein
MSGNQNSKRDGDTDRQAGRDSLDSSSNAQRAAETPTGDDALRPQGQRRQETRKGPRKSPRVDPTESTPTDNAKGE